MRGLVKHLSICHSPVESGSGWHLDTDRNTWYMVQQGVVVTSCVNGLKLVLLLNEMCWNKSCKNVGRDFRCLMSGWQEKVVHIPSVI